MTGPASPPTRDGVGPSSIVLPPGAWRSIAEFLSERFPAVSLDEWLARLHGGEVLDAEGRALKPDSPYRAHCRLYYYRNLPPEPPIPFEERIVHQDDDILVADKPHFLPVTPSGRYLRETLLVRLKRRTGIDTLSPAHRIDRETGGLVLFTARPALRNTYQRLFRERGVVKSYEAVARHHPDFASPKTVSHRIVAGDSFMRMQVVEGAPNAETMIDIIEARHGVARYRLQPSTGLKHQLRVQMAALGMPILNDRIYPVHFPEKAADGSYLPNDNARPLQLLATSLGFIDPLSGLWREFAIDRHLSLPP